MYSHGALAGRCQFELGAALGSFFPALSFCKTRRVKDFNDDSLGSLFLLFHFSKVHWMGVNNSQFRAGLRAKFLQLSCLLQWEPFCVVMVFLVSFAGFYRRDCSSEHYPLKVMSSGSDGSTCAKMQSFANTPVNSFEV